MHKKPFYNDYSTTQLATAIAEWVFSERDRAIMRRKLIDGITYEKLAEEFDMSDKQISRIVNDLKGVILKHLDTRVG